ncbi:hypothetical protein LSAT2_012090 [Lamellibrachia satsuma]|nr:hypothetical protein LSAT2_012090 [Lamellibrachia satsuma]
MSAGTNQAGRMFVLAFTQNRVLLRYPICRIYFTSREDRQVDVVITTPKEPDFDPGYVTVRPGKTAMYQYPYDMYMSGSSLKKKGIRVEASGDIIVQAGSINSLTSDGFLVLPLEALGYEYLVMSYRYEARSMFHQGPSQFGVVGTQDSTRISILLPSSDTSIDFDGWTRFMIRRNGRILKLTIDAYETLQVRSPDDLTGTKILTNKPVAVFSGSEWTSVGYQQMGDHLVEQMPPTSTWGWDFITVPIATRTAGDIFRVLARDNDTRVRIAHDDGSAAYTETVLLDGAGYTDVSGLSGESLTISCSRPVLVAQLCKSSGADGNQRSDPFMSLVPPVVQYANGYNFTTIKSARTEYDNYVSVVAPTTELHGLRLDGRPLSSAAMFTDWTHLVSTKYSVATLTITPGVHSLGHSDRTAGIGVVLYGLKLQESYALIAGQEYAAVNYVSVPDEGGGRPGDGVDNDCDQFVDEELPNGLDDDDDGLVDEDVAGDGSSVQDISSYTPASYLYTSELSSEFMSSVITEQLSTPMTSSPSSSPVYSSDVFTDWTSVVSSASQSTPMLETSYFTTHILFSGYSVSFNIIETSSMMVETIYLPDTLTSSPVMSSPTVSSSLPLTTSVMPTTAAPTTLAETTTVTEPTTETTTAMETTTETTISMETTTETTTAMETTTEPTTAMETTTEPTTAMETTTEPTTVMETTTETTTTMETTTETTTAMETTTETTTAMETTTEPTTAMETTTEPTTAMETTTETTTAMKTTTETTTVMESTTEPTTAMETTTETTTAMETTTETTTAMETTTEKTTAMETTTEPTTTETTAETTTLPETTTETTPLETMAKTTTAMETTTEPTTTVAEMTSKPSPPIPTITETTKATSAETTRTNTIQTTTTTTTLEEMTTETTETTSEITETITQITETSTGITETSRETPDTDSSFNYFDGSAQCAKEEESNAQNRNRKTRVSLRVVHFPAVTIRNRKDRLHQVNVPTTVHQTHSYLRRLSA